MACDAARTPVQGVDKGLRPTGKAKLPVGDGLFDIEQNGHIARNSKNFLN